MQKLSMDLIPYASRKFDGIDPDQIPLLFPYLETLFHEIFRTKRTRKYVIFCSAFYNDLFEQYNEWEKRKWEVEVYKKQDSKEVFDQKDGKKRLAYCTPIIIRQNDNGRQQPAIIAHTFPNQSLPNAYEKMEKYGSFCFKVWKEAFEKI